MTVPSPWLFQRIVEEMPEAVIVSDRAGVIVFWNRAAEVMFGHSAAEAVGQSLDLIIPERYRALHWAGYRTVMSTGVTRDDCPMGTRAGIPNRAWTGNDSGHPAGHGVRLVGRPIRVGDCVRLSDGRTGRVRPTLRNTIRVRVRRKTSATHQFVAVRATMLRRVDCPKGWMSPRGYARYLRVTLGKMRTRLARRRTTAGRPRRGGWARS